jgi:protein TonB
MFERLVVSTIQRRKHTTEKFFLGTMALYLFALGCAFVVSILVSNPRLADTGSVLILVGPPPTLGGTPPKTPPSRRPQPTDARADPNHAMTLDEIFRHRNNPPVIPNIDQPPAGPGSAFFEGPPGVGPGIGVPGGNTSVEPALRPEPSKPKPAPQPVVTDTSPVRLTSSVLQGKAIERIVPLYPELPKRIRLQGDVSVEVMISAEGRVESARAVSGHPMLVQAALDAARRWRFGPRLSTAYRCA